MSSSLEKLAGYITDQSVNAETINDKDTEEKKVRKPKFKTSLQKLAEYRVNKTEAANVPVQQQETEQQEEEDPNASPGFVRSIARGIDETQGALYGAVALAGSAVGSEKLQEFGLEGYQRNIEEAAENAGTQEFLDIRSAGDAAVWATETMGSLLPTMAEAAVGALIGSVVATPGAGTAVGALAGRTVLRKSIAKLVRKGVSELTEKQIKAAGSRAAAKKIIEQNVLRQSVKTLGAQLGMGAAVLPLESGNNYMEVLTEHGVDNPGTALLTGALATSLEYIGGNSKLIRKFFGGDAAKAFKKGGNSAVRAAKTILANSSQEFAQEAGQEFLSALNIVAATGESLPDGTLPRLIEAGAAGALAGGAGGGLNVALGRSTEGQQDRTGFQPETFEEAMVRNPTLEDTPEERADLEAAQVRLAQSSREQQIDPSQNFGVELDKEGNPIPVAELTDPTVAKTGSTTEDARAAYQDIAQKQAAGEQAEQQRIADIEAKKQAAAEKQRQEIAELQKQRQIEVQAQAINDANANQLYMNKLSTPAGTLQTTSALVSKLNTSNATGHKTIGKVLDRVHKDLYNEEDSFDHLQESFRQLDNLEHIENNKGESVLKSDVGFQALVGNLAEQLEARMKTVATLEETKRRMKVASQPDPTKAPSKAGQGANRTKELAERQQEAISRTDVGTGIQKKTTPSKGQQDILNKQAILKKKLAKAVGPTKATIDKTVPAKVEKELSTKASLELKRKRKVEEAKKKPVKKKPLPKYKTTRETLKQARHGRTVEEHRTEIDRSLTAAKARLKNTTEIITVRNQRDLKTGKHAGLFKQMEKDKTLDNKNVKALYDPNTKSVVIFSDNNANVYEAKNSAWHELGHNSLQDLLGADKVSTVVKGLRDKHAKTLRVRVAEYYGEENAGNNDYMMREAEEMLMEKFENYNETKGEVAVSRLMNLMTKFARKIGMGKAVNKSDIQKLIRTMRKNITSGKKERIDTEKAKISTTQKPKYSRKTEQDPLKELQKEITGTTIPKGVVKPAETDDPIGDYKKEMLGKYKRTQQRVNNFKLGIWDKFLTKSADSNRILKLLEKGLNLKPGTSGYKSLSLLTNFPTIFDTFLRRGIVEYDNGWIKMTKDTDGLEKMTEKLGDSADDFYKWSMAQSAKEILAKDDGDRFKGDRTLFGQDEKGQWLDDNKVIAQMEAETKDAYAANKELWDNSVKQMQAINKSVLDFAEKAGMIDPQKRAVWERDIYIPFYRNMENWTDETFETMYPKTGQGNVKSVIKKLEGGKQSVGDPMMNLFNGYSFLLHESLKNLALRKAIGTMKEYGLAEQVAPVLDGENITKIRFNGKTEAYSVYDPYLLQVLKGFPPSSYGAMMKVAQYFKRMLTFGATVAPAFRVANFTRDTLHTAFINKSFIPVVDSTRGFFSAWNESDYMTELKSTGGAFTGSYHLRDILPDTEVGVKRLKKKLRAGKVSKLNIWQTYRKLGEVSENAARLGLYMKLRKEGASAFEAGYQAKDLLDFHKSGASSMLRGYLSVVPFMNARIQGMYKLGSTAKSEQGRASMAMWGAILATLSFTLHSMNDDNEEYKKLTDSERMVYWHLYTPMGHIRIPKPFEVGTIFGSVTEALIEVGKKEKNSDEFFEYMQALGTDMFRLDAPQLAKIVAHQIGNKDSFTGQPVVSRRLEGVDPRYQYTSKTSSAIRALGEATGASPQRLEKMINDIYGFAGFTSLALLDQFVNPITDYGTKPEPHLTQSKLAKVTGVSRFYRGKDKGVTYNRKTQQFYKLLNEAQVTYTTYRRLVNDRQLDDARKYRESNKDKLKAYKGLKKTQSAVNKINTQIRLIERSKKYLPAEKQTKIDGLQKRKTKLMERRVDQ